MKLQIDNPIFSFIKTFCEFTALNFVFLITCLPVITIGCALTSLYQVTLQEAGNENGYLIRTYLSAMRTHFRKATLIYLFYFILVFVLLFNLFFWASFEGLAGALLLLPVMAVFLAVLISMLYAFPLLAMFDLPLMTAVKTAYPLAMHHKKTTLALLFFHSLAAFLFFLLPSARVFMAVIGFSFLAYCSSYLLIRVCNLYKEKTQYQQE